MEKGRVTHSSLFLVRVLKTDAKKRVSTVVPKKVSKTAVGRNKLRRQMYEAIAPLFSSMIDGVHVIVFAKNTAIETPFVDLSAEMKTVFVKAGLLR